MPGPDPARPSSAPPFDLQTLGGLALSGPDGPWTGKASRPRARALLAVLARAGERGLTRDRLCFLLWADRPQERARHSLEQLLYLVRAELGGEVVGRSSDPVVLNPRVLRSDVAAFSAALADGALEKAVRCFAGPFLYGFHLSGAPEFDRWADAERGELDRCHREALESLALRAVEVDDPLEAVRWCRRWVAADPFSSRAALRLMEALAGIGDRGSALEVAERHATRLADGLEAAPDPAVSALAKRLTASPVGTGHAAAASTHGPAPGSGNHRTDPPLVAIHVFDDDTGDGAGEMLGRSAAEWIANALLRTGLVRVTLESTGAAAGRCDARVEGRIYRSGDDLLVQARVHGPGEELAVLDPVRVSGADPMAALEPVRRQVVVDVGSRFDDRIKAWRDTALRPPRLEAYRAFAAGHERWAERRFGEALDAFREAIDHDPGFAPPRLWAAWTLIMLRQWDAAKAAVERAAQHPDLSPLDRAWLSRMEAHLRGDHEGAFRAAQTMSRLSPRSGWTWSLVNTALDTRRHAFARTVLLQADPSEWGLEERSYWAMLAWTDHMLGEHERELDTIAAGLRAVAPGWINQYAQSLALAATGRLALLLDELAPLIRGTPTGMMDAGALLVALGRELRCHGHDGEAERFVQVAVDEYAEDGSAAWVGDPVHLAELHYDHGDLGRASAVALDALGGDGQIEGRLGVLGLVAAARGDRATSDERSEELRELPHLHVLGRPSLWRARIAGALGDHDQALALLRQGAAEGFDRFDWLEVHRVPELVEVRRMPGYHRLVSRS